MCVCVGGGGGLEYLNFFNYESKFKKEKKSERREGGGLEKVIFFLQSI